MFVKKACGERVTKQTELELWEKIPQMVNAAEVAKPIVETQEKRWKQEKCSPFNRGKRRIGCRTVPFPQWHQSSLNKIGFAEYESLPTEVHRFRMSHGETLDFWIVEKGSSARSIGVVPTQPSSRNKNAGSHGKTIICRFTTTTTNATAPLSWSNDFRKSETTHFTTVPSTLTTLSPNV